MATPPYLVRLMHTRGFVGRKSAEDAEALRFAMMLREATLQLRLRAVWFHPPLEVMRATAQCALASAMGAIDGVSDYVFLARDGSMAIEMKSETGRQTKNQVDFAAWCALHGIPYHVGRKAEQGMSLLRDRGWLA